jgi:tetratricopeptide (TPR) repeat protein
MVFFNKESSAIERYEHSIALFSQDTQARYCLASLLARENSVHYQPAKALSLFEALVEQHPQVAVYPFNAGYLRQKMDFHAEALPLFEQAVRLDPHLDRAWYGMGLSQIALGQLEAAIVSLKRNTELQPMSPYGWYQLSMAQANLGLWHEARATAKHLSTFEPKFARGLIIDLDQLKNASPTES